MTHRIESVKIINQADPHERELYGAVTHESAYRVEIIPDRSRVYCLAITATDDRDRGRPSSWSAAVDALAAGENDQRRLLILSAGNTDPGQRRHYPDSNMTDGVHDPAQAWNALTVGGYTEKAVLDGAGFPGWGPLAPRGDLAHAVARRRLGQGPAGRSSPISSWKRATWPSTPRSRIPTISMTGCRLLSYAPQFHPPTRPLTSFGDTSAATALAARIRGNAVGKISGLARRKPCARSWFMPPNGRLPWSPVSRAQTAASTTRTRSVFWTWRTRTRRLLRVVDNSLTLVVESEIQPFFKDRRGQAR